MLKEKFCLLLILLLISQMNHAQEVSSSLKDATVYTRGAMLTHECMISFKEGNQKVIISGVSNNIEENSILISLPEFSNLLSIKPNLIPIDNSKYSSTARILLDSMEYIGEAISSINNEINVETYGEQLLKKNDVLTNRDEFNTEDIIKAYNEYRKALQASFERKTALQKEVKELQKIQNRLINRKKELGITSDHQMVLEVLLQNTKTQNQRVNFAYYTSNAAWAPSYTIINEDASPEVELNYKAKITQNTGFNWKNVKLSVSTGNPQLSNLQPTISTWFIQYYVPYNQVGYSNTGKRVQAEAYLDMSEEKLESRDDKFKEVVQVSDNIVNTNFEIPIAYDVPVNSPVLTELQDYKIPADIYFYAVPKQDKDVYLLASFTFDRASELIPGEALIMNNGEYVGKTHIDPYVASDTMRISLGRSPNVQVKRTAISNMCKNSFLGNNKTTTKYYEFQVYNGLSRAIDIVIKDQIPISTNKDISVETLELDKGIINKDAGIVTWDFNLSPRQEKKFNFGFEVKYPKNKSMQGL